MQVRVDFGDPTPPPAAHDEATRPTDARAPDATRPNEIREAVLSQHRSLRRILDEVEEWLGQLAQAPSSANPSVLARLRACTRELHLQFGLHLDFEDRHLVPAVRDADAWGEERARLIEAEHAEQRVLLEYLEARLASTELPTSVLRNTIREFVDILRKDMQHEERDILGKDLLRDDVVSIDCELG